MMEEETKERELQVPVEGGLGGKHHLDTNKSQGISNGKPWTEALTPLSAILHQVPSQANQTLQSLVTAYRPHASQ